VRRLLRALAVVALLVLIAGFVVGSLFLNAVYRDRTHPQTDTHVIIARGSTFTEIATQLADAGVIANPLTFRLLARLRHDETDVKAGEYRFAPHQTQADVLRSLLSGGAQVAVWITIPEGFTAKQIAQRLHENGVGDTNAFANAFLHDTIDVGGTRTESLEGFLFPSTYLIPTDASATQVEGLLTSQFFKELPRDAAQAASALHMTVPQVVAVASLIEREAKIDSERAIMAGVYYNRLRLRMPLEVDATIEYALPEHKTALTYADLAMDSPYNTYQHTGLPPTPIANPGAPSLAAAFHPAKTDYLYYVYEGNGHHAFAKTLAEHNANVARYEK
jgi:peptidoglycan lytic transglycosylase G